MSVVEQFIQRVFDTIFDFLDLIAKAIFGDDDDDMNGGDLVHA